MVSSNKKSWHSFTFTPLFNTCQPKSSAAHPQLIRDPPQPGLILGLVLHAVPLPAAGCHISQHNVFEYYAAHDGLVSLLY